MYILKNIWWWIGYTINSTNNFSVDTFQTHAMNWNLKRSGILSLSSPIHAQNTTMSLFGDIVMQKSILEILGDKLITQTHAYLFCRYWAIIKFISLKKIAF